MSQFDFAGLSETSPLIKSLRAALMKGSGQAVPYVVVGKVKRVTGVSIKDVDMTLENGQTVTYRVKNTGDIFRVQLNGKDLPLKGDMTMLNDVSKEIGEKVRAAQPAFDKRQAAARVVIPKSAASSKVMTTVQRLKAAQEQEAKLDDAIAKATAIRDDLKVKLEGHANGGIPSGKVDAGAGLTATAPVQSAGGFTAQSSGGVGVVRLFDSYRAKKPIPARDFNAADFAVVHNDPAVDADAILASFPPDTKQKMAEVQARVDALVSTDKLHKVDGKYTLERQKYHTKIMTTAGLAYDEDGNALPALVPANAEQAKPFMPKDGEQPVFILLGGRGGSGKSRFKGMVYSPPPAVVIDADGIKERMTEYKGWNAAEVHEESSDIVEKALRKCRRLGVSVVLDATMKSDKPDTFKTIQAFKKAGYRIEVHYMHLPRQEAAKRAVGRFLNPKSGRYVPIDVVLGNTTNEGTFEKVKLLADAWSFRDNNVPRGADPILISSSG